MDALVPVFTHPESQVRTLDLTNMKVEAMQQLKRAFTKAEIIIDTFLFSDMNSQALFEFLPLLKHAKVRALHLATKSEAIVQTNYAPL